ncbi:DUF3027 domain-containing protein [Arthrobacter sp. Br18]|uniref:DUF3027 domain-containing protein n=1 Tax=Arthrobacter sp. Br18 TaxID=1312954 RepID=UPI0005671A9A|nr:DUF3027 domain-containing protein [Arthrobacter sp. Br18]
MTSGQSQSDDDAFPDAGVVPAPVAKRRAAKRPAKADALLEAAVDFARAGVLQVASNEQVGRHVTSYPDGERLLTHRFEAFVPGYGEWEWFATLARVPRGKEPSICEVGLLPSDRALIAPEWLPWSQRVRPEDSQDAEVPPAAVEKPMVVEDGVVVEGSQQEPAEDAESADAAGDEPAEAQGTGADS